MVHGIDYMRIIREITFSGFMLGCAVGSLFGTFIAPIFLTVIGFACGATMGILLGLVNGVSVAAITAWFQNRDHTYRYVQLCSLSSTAITFTVTVITLIYLFSAIAPGNEIKMIAPALIAALMAGWVCGGIAMRVGYEGEFTQT